MYSENEALQHSVVLDIFSSVALSYISRKKPKHTSAACVSEPILEENKNQTSS